ncbi:50S ribosomal protein L10 [Ignicoccus hospitalis]|uniref:Large ribosomal subunit protein uL10 n=1 Tax=Ignicoccus hospitalis (strain KIN4/I / DSM 18386 / JCM 14125) TaxID=453591 RepID=RL10_IGNH4|nr:50S ribosomal protein L10 [Ignicoccus hospitalis]A8ABQ7.1 RecName: Full=Large ribosomal subunit protein uL10; AltName: Full=50S ribosomal protein L10; AltName: Full=Acidic ribosomal protein P0 homolog [Ignicoccus hospitalis KIN4/I]ABU82359.1 LSU ribosomal protein L10P [Ignicoccus hospitalis KIN4/I]
MSAITGRVSTYHREKFPEWKVKLVNEVKEKLKENDVVLVLDLVETPANLVHKFRKKFRKELPYMKVIKNNLVRKAFEQSGIEMPKEMDEQLVGSNMFIFTNDNPFKLALKISKFSMPAPAKPGDVAQSEIVVPAGDTGLTPGPILSTFGKLKIKTMVKGGTIHIAKDTVVAKPGDVISPELASLLQKLGITPMELKMKIKGAYIKSLNRWVPAEELVLDLNKYKEQIQEAYTNALALGVSIAYPVPEVLKLSVAKAFQDALKVAVEAGWLTKETAPYLLSKAYAQALALVGALGDKAKELGIEVEVPAAPAPEAKEEKKEEAEEEEEEKKEVSEEDLSAGLGALFG